MVGALASPEHRPTKHTWVWLSQMVRKRTGNFNAGGNPVIGKHHIQGEG